jgi:hypothetical protein
VDDREPPRYNRDRLRYPSGCITVTVAYLAFFLRRRRRSPSYRSCGRQARLQGAADASGDAGNSPRSRSNSLGLRKNSLRSPSEFPAFRQEAAADDGFPPPSAFHRAPRRRGAGASSPRKVWIHNVIAKRGYKP